MVSILRGGTLRKSDCVFHDVYDAGGRCCGTHHLLTDRDIQCERGELEKILRMKEMYAETSRD